MYYQNSVIWNWAFVIGLVCWFNVKSSEAFGRFGFDIHHRYSDAVRDYLDVDGLPEKGSLDYYTAMAHRDHLLHARRLATDPSSRGLVTFFGSNQTLRSPSFGFLHYANVTVGTPPLVFLVALDTGSDLFWLPCDCTTCARSLSTTSGRIINLSIYSPGNSSTSAPVSCNSTMCGRRRGCLARYNACAYQEIYLSANTSSTGILVDDVLHLGTESAPQSPVDVPITLGCGLAQTGDFLDGAAVNGLFGLGMDNVSVPSILANRGFAANSFSMCFGPDGIGRIEFGDKGSPDQKTTPFNLRELHPTYNVTVTQISVERNITDAEFSTIFDSGTSFSYLNDPAYSIIVERFNSMITEPRYSPPQRIIFDYCYELSASQDSYNVPMLNLTMQGGSQYFVTDPTVVIPRQGGLAYCLAIVKSEDINIIGQNFMTGYRLVFDREDMVLGWKEADCYGSVPSTSTLPVDNRNSSNAPAPIFDPEATAGNTVPPFPSSRTPASGSGSGSIPGSNAANVSNYMVSTLLMIIFSIFSHHFTLLSS